jgi:lipopolysaccharide biosynthesis glycosyltransferase
MRNAIVLITDGNIFPAAVFAAERIAKLRNRDDTDVFVFTDAEAELRAAPARHYPFRVVPIIWPGGETRFSAQFFRMVVPLQMVSRYARVLYIDIDTYVESETLFALFDLDMQGHVIAAVRDLVVSNRDDVELRATMRDGGNRYFNSGVMLIDCQRYAAERVLDGIWQMFSRPSEIRYADQSVLNRYFAGRFLELSPAFNFFAGALDSALSRVCPQVLVHFAGRRKPWAGAAFTISHRARAEMEHYFPQSPWPGFLARFAPNGSVAPPPAYEAPSFAWGFTGRAPVAKYLRETPFADVEQGLTRLDLAALSSRPPSD